MVLFHFCIVIFISIPFVLFYFIYLPCGILLRLLFYLYLSEAQQVQPNSEYNGRREQCAAAYPILWIE